MAAPSISVFADPRPHTQYHIDEDDEDLDDGLGVVGHDHSDGGGQSDDDLDSDGEEQNDHNREGEGRIGDWTIRDTLQSSHFMRSSCFVVLLFIYRRLILLLADDFLRKVQHPHFSATEAIDMLNKPLTLDYSKSNNGSTPGDACDIYPEFHLDLFIVIGHPLQAIARPVAFFDSTEVSFQKWNAPYSHKHAHGVHFNMKHRTFRLATSGTRDTWFIVMHPLTLPPEELLATGERIKQRKESSKLSAMKRNHAEVLASYIVRVFTRTPGLVGVGMEPNWNAGGRESITISNADWLEFQRSFVRGWGNFVEGTDDTYWRMNEPAFHAYDYGGNQKIEFNDELHQHQPVRRARPEDEMYDEDSHEFLSESSESQNSNMQSNPERQRDPGSSRSTPRDPELSSSDRYEMQHLFAAWLSNTADTEHPAKHPNPLPPRRKMILYGTVGDFRVS